MDSRRYDVQIQYIQAAQETETGESGAAPTSDLIGIRNCSDSLSREGSLHHIDSTRPCSLARLIGLANLKSSSACSIPPISTCINNFRPESRVMPVKGELADKVTGKSSTTLSSYSNQGNGRLVSVMLSLQLLGLFVSHVFVRV
jgi:hypothetical protein